MIDADGTVRHAVINDLPLGRNIDEMLRMVDAMHLQMSMERCVLLVGKMVKEGMKAPRMAEWFLPKPNLLATNHKKNGNPLNKKGPFFGWAFF